MRKLVVVVAALCVAQWITITAGRRQAQKVDDLWSSYRAHADDPRGHEWAGALLVPEKP